MLPTHRNVAETKVFEIFFESDRACYAQRLFAERPYFRPSADATILEATLAERLESWRQAHGNGSDPNGTPALVPHTVAVFVLEEVASGLAHLHKHGRAHGRLSTASIAISDPFLFRRKSAQPRTASDLPICKIADLEKATLTSVGEAAFECARVEDMHGLAGILQAMIDNVEPGDDSAVWDELKMTLEDLRQPVPPSASSVAGRWRGKWEAEALKSVSGRSMAHDTAR